jgi:hypothetical protein
MNENDKKIYDAIAAFPIKKELQHDCIYKKFFDRINEKYPDLTSEILDELHE